MKINFKPYGQDARLPKIGSICLCECSGFCKEGVIAAEYTRDGFVFSGHGNINEHITGYVTLEF